MENVTLRARINRNLFLINNELTLILNGRGSGRGLMLGVLDSGRGFDPTPGMVRF